MADLGASPFTISTTANYTIPTGVNYLTVEAWGGGQAGYFAVGYSSGGGGGAGGYGKRNIMRVVAGNSYTFTVGTGGNVNVGGEAGTSSLFTDADGYVVQGYFGDHGTGASVANCIGNVIYGGGNGGAEQNQNDSVGGGGGESGGPNGTGSNGSSSAAGGAGGTGHADAGDGGAGGVAEIGSHGDNGVVPGGGGGGAASKANTFPGNGANGKIVVTYHTGSPLVLFSTTDVTIPLGVTAIAVECYSGGGSGGPGNESVGGGGAGAGGYAKRNSMRVIPNKTYTFTVAASVVGQSGGTGLKFGLDGGVSYFTGEDGVVCQARFGTGGATTGYGSASGTAYGDTAYDGGHGGQYSATGGAGGGGEGASTTAAGNVGTDGGVTGGAGGTGGDGGDGGAGGNFGMTGSAGIAPGGGGGGGGKYNGATYGSSGAGARGQIIITYGGQLLTTRAFNGGVANDRNMAF